MRHPKRYVATNGDVSWRVRYRSTSGTEKSETFYDEATAVEFAQLVKALGVARALAYIDERQRAEGDHRDRALTVDDLFARWHDWKAAKDRKGQTRRVRSARTVGDYERMYRHRIKPTLGGRPANLVSQSDVQGWVDALGAELAPKTVADYHSLLHQVYKWGLHPSRALVVGDPCQETDLPRRMRKPPKGLQPAEWQILHQAATNVDPAAADLLLFLVATGWRWSEAAAVQTMAVDHWTEDGKSFTFVTMGRVLRRTDHGFEFIDDQAKSASGFRRVRITGAAERMVLWRIEGRAPTDLILTTARGGRWRYEHFYNRVWARPKHGDDTPNRVRILEEAARLGLDRPGLTPHWLRHTHVGMLILAGENITAIQRRLGHASIKTTNDTYGRMIEDATQVGLDKLAAMIGEPISRPGLSAGDLSRERRASPPRP